MVRSFIKFHKSHKKPLQVCYVIGDAMRGRFEIFKYGLDFGFQHHGTLQFFQRKSQRNSLPARNLLDHKTFGIQVPQLPEATSDRSCARPYLCQVSYSNDHSNDHSNAFPLQYSSSKESLNESRKLFGRKDNIKQSRRVHLQHTNS